MKCRICANESPVFTNAHILNKYNIQYFRCNFCGFIQTEEPYWLKEVYVNAINTSDIGLVHRNIITSKLTQSVIRLFFDGDGKFIDYGGGYGLFVRLMRDAGYNFYRHDIFCENLFAKGFDADINIDSRFEILTAFEVFEHLVDPLSEIEKMLALSRNILFSTETVPINVPKPEEWWYYGLEHGQHISLFTHTSLKIIAKRFGLHLCSYRGGFHILTQRPITPWIFKLALSPTITAVINRTIRRKSLLASDYFLLTNRQLN